MFDIVYCIDKNFNKQAFLSISSLLETHQTRFYNIYIIHKNPLSFYKYKRKLGRIFSMKNIKILKFRHKIKNYPNLKKSHVSEATYYRMFIGEYISNSKDFVIYIDADAYFVNNIEKKIEEVIKKMIKKNYLIGAKTEFDLIKNESPDIFKRLEMNHRYFNAGVMVINLKNWKYEKFSEKLIEQLNYIANKIIFWDQDVLNSLINGNFEELPFELNYLVDINFPENLSLNNVDIVHYAGKVKPWTKRGLSINSNTYYNRLSKKYL